MSNVFTTTDEAAILGRVIVPTDGSLSQQVAEELTKLSFPEADMERMNELAEKNRLGTATPSDLEEIERYSRVGNLLNLLQSKARHSLQNE